MLFGNIYPYYIIYDTSLIVKAYAAEKTPKNAARFWQYRHFPLSL